MGLFDFLLFVVVGCGVGFLAGMFGIGGGLLIVPLLIFSYSYSGISPSVQTHLAIGTSLFIIIFTSLTNSFQQHKQHNIYWRCLCNRSFERRDSLWRIEMGCWSKR